MKLQAPSSKLQRNTKLQTPTASGRGWIPLERARFEVWDLELFWSLDLGAWSFPQ
jgi:hypothetical protein